MITQVPLGDAGGAAGPVVGVQPLRVTVTCTDRASWTTTRQSGAVKPEARILNRPSCEARTPAAEVVERALMKLGAAPEPSTVSCPPWREAVLTLREAVPAPAAVAPLRATGPASMMSAAAGRRAARNRAPRFMTVSFVPRPSEWSTDARPAWESGEGDARALSL